MLTGQALKACSCERALSLRDTVAALATASGLSLPLLLLAPDPVVLLIQPDHGIFSTAAFKI